MAVVTISREFGSAGSFIARQVAQTLGYHFVDKKTIEQVLVQYGYVEFRQEYDSVPGFWAAFDMRRAEMMGMLNRVIQALAAHNNIVIAGRGSFAVLPNFVDVLHVRIQAPPAVRIERVLARQDTKDRDSAEAAMKENDRLRAAFVESLYGVKWDAVSAFDLVINTGKIAPEVAVSWLVSAVQSLTIRPEDTERTTRALTVDSILAAAVADVLNCQEVHQPQPVQS
ncbi:MAG: Cytidylate kinase [Anaerolineae bacterium]|nr:Cytidylate kinase [Anaerolineae bacterium]